MTLYLDSKLTISSFMYASTVSIASLSFWRGIIYPSDEFQDSGAKSCIDILLRQSVLAIPISHQY